MSCKINRPFLIILVFVFSIIPVYASAQDNSPVTLGTYRTLHSDILGEDRTLLVYLPADYDTTDKKYPVLYKLDGEVEIFMQTATAALYLTDMAGKIPGNIIVAIQNTDRFRDMGLDRGADKFLQFFKQELIPFIDNNYRTEPFRLLCGQSFSTMFTAYTMLKEPELFQAFILNSFGLSDKWLPVYRDEYLPRTQFTNTEKLLVFIAQGQRDPYDPDGVRAKNGQSFIAALQQSVGEQVLVQQKNYPEEGHVPYPALYDGLIWIYANRECPKE